MGLVIGIDTVNNQMITISIDFKLWVFTIRTLGALDFPALSFEIFTFSVVAKRNTSLEFFVVERELYEERKRGLEG